MSVTLTSEQLSQLITDAVSAAALQSNTSTDESTAQVNRSSRRKPDRPSLNQGVDDAQWQFFVEEWNLYKRMANLQDEHIGDELRLCCSRELRQSLFDFVWSANITNTDENTMLQHLKSIAVIGKNIAVHRQEFHLLNVAIRWWAV